MFLRIFTMLTLIGLSIDLNSQTEASLPSDSTIIDTSKQKDIIPDYLNEYDAAYYKIDYINKGLGEVPLPMNRFTPQAALESYYTFCRNEEFDRAAHILNLNLLPEVAQLDESKVLAEKLYYILNRRLNVNWNDIPDRPDGQVNIASIGEETTAGKPRRNIEIGVLKHDGRDVKVGLQRVKVKDTAPYWVISAQTVEHIEELYQAFGPSEFARNMPSWSKTKVLGLELWRILGIIILFIGTISLFIGLKWVFNKIGEKSDHFWISNISSKIATPIALLVAFITFSTIFENVISLSNSWGPIIYSIMMILIIATLIWTIITSVDYVFNLISEYKVDDISNEENKESRALLTYISIGRKVLTFGLIILGLALVLMQFGALEKIGVSLLASAGAATLILGIAAQGTLGNLFAGLQIAFSNPIRIGDTIEFEDHYGVIENIRFTYLVIKTIDDKRVVIPLQYFISKPFENWSKKTAHTIKPISIYADPKTDVSKVRSKIKEILKNKEDYDYQEDPAIEVVSMSPHSIEIRVLVHGKDPGTAWNHQVELREQIIRMVAELNDGKYLAKERLVELDPQY